MTKQLFGTKQGMTTFFDEKGNLVVCTLITVDKHIAVQVKTEDGKDGYSAIQYGARTQKPKHTTKPLAGHFKKAGVEPRKKLFEVRFKGDAPHQVGDEVGLELFEGLTHVDVIGKSKGKGFQGVIKRYGFKGGPAAHGSKFHRQPGSIGNRTWPGRVIPGKKLPGHFGNEKVTVKNVEIVEVNTDDSVLLVKGPVPGARNTLVKLMKV